MAEDSNAVQCPDWFAKSREMLWWKQGFSAAIELVADLSERGEDATEILRTAEFIRDYQFEGSDKPPLRRRRVLHHQDVREIRTAIAAGAAPSLRSMD